MFNVVENRKFPRMAVDCSIRYKHEDAADFKQAVARNISGNGMLFVTQEPAVVGDLMEIHVNPGTLSIPVLSAVVEVVRVLPVGGSDATDVDPDAADCEYEIATRIKLMK